MSSGRDHGYLYDSRKQYRPVDEGGCVWWNEPRAFSRWEAWRDMIQSASFAPHERLVNGAILSLERGETPPRSIRYLAVRWGRSTKWVRNFLTQAEEMGRLVPHQRHAEGHTYLVVNYDTYQSNGHTQEPKRNTARAQPGHSQGTARAQSRRKGKEGKGSKTPPTPPTQNDEPWGELPKSIDTEAVRESLRSYYRHRKQKRQSMTDEAWRRLLKKLERWGPALSVESLEHSIEKGWTGVFAPDGGPGNRGKANNYALPGYDPREDYD